MITSQAHYLWLHLLLEMTERDKIVKAHICPYVVINYTVYICPYVVINYTVLLNSWTILTFSIFHIT